MMEAHSGYAHTAILKFPDSFIGPLPKFNFTSGKHPEVKVQERIVTTGFRARIRPAFVQKSTQRSVPRGSQTASPDLRDQKAAEPRTSEDGTGRKGAITTITGYKLPSASQSPIKQVSGRVHKEGVSFPMRIRPETGVGGLYQSLADLLNESSITKKYLLVRENRSQARPRHSLSQNRSQTPIIQGKVGISSNGNYGKSLEKRGKEEQRQTHNKKEERISVKEAMRDKNWLQKAKEGIIASSSLLLMQSNGLIVENQGIHTGYRLYVGKGNNAQLVKALFTSRWWWTRVDEDEKSSAHLVWTQWLDQSAIEKSPPALIQFPRETVQTDPILLNSTVRFNPTNGLHRFQPFGKTVDLSPLNFDLIFRSDSYRKQRLFLQAKPGDLRTCNKLENNHHLANKKSLFLNMKLYYECMGSDPFQTIPVTFHIKDGENDPEFSRFSAVFQALANAGETGCRNIWILKPGENTNRGTGISLCNSIAQIQEEIRQGSICTKTGQKRTFILQKYIENPFLIHRRKFDIRLYALVTSINGVLQAYFYREGYIRTSSKEFSLNNIGNKLIHLTNDAVQKYAEDYGKFEMANKLSYSDFQRYLDYCNQENLVDFSRQIVPHMKEIVKDTIQSVYLKLDPRHRTHSFEVGFR